MFRRHNLRGLIVILALLLLLPVIAHATSIINTSSPNVLVDEFDDPMVAPNTGLPWDYWYKLLISADAQGYYRKENLTGQVDCNVDVCITDETEDSINFARLSISPFEYEIEDHVSIVQIGEQRDSFAYNFPHRWEPTPGHPIVFKVRFRASSTYEADASGSAVGNWGFTLFNYSDYFSDPLADVSRDNSSFSRNSNDFFLLGFTWFDAGNVFGLLPGLYAAAGDQIGLVPSYLFPIRNIDINSWTDAKITWEENFLGVQTVKYYINNQLVGVYIPLFPMPSLAIQLYVNNERFVLGANGLVPAHVEIPALQYIDIDSVDIRKN